MADEYGRNPKTGKLNWRFRKFGNSPANLLIEKGRDKLGLRSIFNPNKGVKTASAKSIDEAKRLKRATLQRKHHEKWLQKIDIHKTYETYPETWRDFTKAENLKLRRGSQEAGKHRPLPNTTKFHKTAGGMEAIQGKVVQKAKTTGTFSKDTLSGMTKKGAASFARGQNYAQMGGLEDDQIIHEVSKARMRDKAALPKVQTKGKKTLLTNQRVKSKGGGKSGGGGGGKWGWIRRAINRPSSPWSLLKNDKNY